MANGDGLHPPAAARLLHDALHRGLCRRDRGLRRRRWTTGTPTPTTGEDGLLALALADAALKSVAEGRVVKVARCWADDEAARRHHHRPVVGRPLRRAGRRAARGHGVASRSTSAARPPTSPAGTARLGLKSALITRVGDEHMGRFIREQLAREGVDVRGVEDRPRAADRAGAARHPRRARSSR